MTEGNATPMYMPVAPAYGYGGGGGFGNGFGGDGWWIILLILLCGSNWGNGFGGGFGGGMNNGLYPWLNNSNQINDGFRDQMLNDNITSIRDGVNSISNQLCNGFAGTTAAITGAQNALAQQMYANQIADMQQTFGVQSALQNCCCENRAGIADLKYTVATENCADRTQSMMNTRDIIDSQTRGTQAILDKLCALELDGVKGQLADANNTIGQLRTQLLVSQGQASQTAQTAQIVNDVYNRFATCPVETVPVFGRQPIYSCTQAINPGCGCGA